MEALHLCAIAALQAHRDMVAVDQGGAGHARAVRCANLVDVAASLVGGQHERDRGLATGGGLPDCPVAAKPAVVNGVDIGNG